MTPARLNVLLDDLLCATRFEGLDDPHGPFVPWGRADVRRIGLALEPWPGIAAWSEAESLDQLFIHRPWRLDDADRRQLAALGVGILAYHLAFDESLTTGLNRTLATACGWGEPVVLGFKESRPLGMMCNLPKIRSFQDEAERLRAQFDGLEDVVPPTAGPGVLIEKVAVIGAMNDALIREAHAAGAGLYATGQWRPSARAAVRETGIGVAVIGHCRSEMWGLRALAGLLRTTDELETVVAPGV